MDRRFYRTESRKTHLSLFHSNFYLFPLKTWQFFFPFSSSSFLSQQRRQASSEGEFCSASFYEPLFYINLRFFYAMLSVVVCESCKICENKQKKCVINIFVLCRRTARKRRMERTVLAVMAYNQSHLLKFCVSSAFNAHFSSPHRNATHTTTASMSRQHYVDILEFSC